MTYTIKANLTDKHEYTQIIPSIFGISDLASMLVYCVCLVLEVWLKDQVAVLRRIELLTLA